MIRQLSMIALLTLAGWINTSNAALIGVCTFASGCGPDFNVSTSLSVNYTYNTGSDTGSLSITSAVQDASFLDGQLDPTWAYGNTSLNVIATAGGNDNFTLNFSVDGSGNLLGSSDITMNGRVVAFDGGLKVAKSFNGTSLDGNLITGGSIDQIGWNNTALDFIGSMNNSSLLAIAGFGGASNSVSGLLSMGSTISSSTGNIEWDENWTAGGTLDVVVPVPAAAWLFASGLIALLSVSRRKSSI